MNNLSVSLTESTIENFLRSQLANITFQNEETSLYDNNGIKIVANVHIRTIEFSDFDLIQPDTFAIKRISVEFEKINIVISADIKHFKDRKVIETPDIPNIRNPITGSIIVHGREVPDIVLWSVDLFGENPDINLTVGLEEFIKPVFSVSFNFITNDFKVSLGLRDFEMHDFVLPESIADTVKNNILEEVEKKIRDVVGNDVIGDVLGKIGDLLQMLPDSDITGLVIDNVVKSDQFEQFVQSQVRSKLGDYVLYVPQSFKLGSDQSPIELSINSPTVNVLDNQITISIDVNEL
ncbi:hypothetical protein [Niallia endozanthoxylica]|uniref:Uncharacterized protein n=1 Tax=Niallia endozanthoxylica TaxID=2036016 RepID=A0A5J5HQW2_9BACI|nr:hypothetical protein [Niallia endozanthoxylica]KAA9023571.1 hypothetical protein F4V44_12960 [Niallia endozanthoxylica]